MEDRWPSGQYSSLTTQQPSGAGAGSGGGSGGNPNLAWQDPNATTSADGRDSDGVVTPGEGQAGLAPLEKQPPPDPFATERPPIVNGGEGAAAGPEIRAKPPVVSRRPIWYSSGVAVALVVLGVRSASGS